MRTRSLVFLPICLLAAPAGAQTAAPAASRQDDRWTPPAAAAGVAATNDIALPGGDATAKPSPFKFKSPHKTREPEPPPPPPRANDEAAVMGNDRPWPAGRPPVDCARTPMDPTCH